MPCDFTKEETSEQLAGFELAWTNGTQEELSEPVAVFNAIRWI